MVPVIGILTLQGAVQDHFGPLLKAGGRPVLVRRQEELDQIDGLIIPGGESTVMGRFLKQYDLVEPIRRKARAGLPLWGICAGSILLARHVLSPWQKQTEPGVLALLPFSAERNSYGRQLSSREQRVFAPSFLPVEGAMMPFIRAPRFLLSDHLGSSRCPGSFQTEEGAEEGRVIAQTEEGEPVGIVGGAEENILVSSFHPELTGETGFHRWLVEKAKVFLNRRSASPLPA